MPILKWLRIAEVAVAGTFLCGIVTIVFVASASRYMGRPVVWGDEVVQALFVWTAMLAGDLTLQRGGHFRINMLTALLPQKAQHVLELVTKLALIATVILLAWYGLQLARLTSARPLPMTGVSSSFATSALPAGFVLMFITLVEQFVVQWQRGSFEQTETRDVV